MYDRTSDIMEVNVARKQLSAHKSRALGNIAPTQAPLQQHIKRASLQASCWNQTLVLIRWQKEEDCLGDLESVPRGD